MNISLLKSFRNMTTNDSQRNRIVTSYLMHNLTAFNHKRRHFNTIISSALYLSLSVYFRFIDTIRLI